jgi:hypothetical protein
MKQHFVKTGIVLLLIVPTAVTAYSQNILNKNISIQATKQRLDNVLEIMSNTGNFYFSYNSSIIKRDSLVTLNFTNKPVREVLNYLFNNGYEYIESGNYIILRRKPITVAGMVKQTPTEDKNYFLAGYVVDEYTGEKLNDASIYEPQQLSSDLSDETGYFKIKLKSRYKTATITVSKESYKDTTITIQPKLNQQLVISLRPENDFTTMITVSPEDYFLPDTIEVQLPTGEKIAYTKADSIKVQKSWIGKFLLSSKQKIQSINLRRFFTTRAFQLSFVPGFGTQGKLSPQITSAVSINILGGYTGGVSAMELGGLFNITKTNVKYLQAAGLLNHVGGNVKGLQLAGLHNNVLDSVKGFQSAGISNYVRGAFKGFQSAGIYNHVSGPMKGVQAAGIANYTKVNANGWQIAGISNFSNREIRGAQLAGIMNYAKKLKGLQLGLINVADSSDGYSIGLFNFVRKGGYHKLSISTNEVTSLNIAFKSGNHKLYSVLHAGTNISASQKLYSFGFGLGHDFRFGKHIMLGAEISSHNLYAGNWDDMNLQNKFSLNLQWQPVKGFSVFAGPSFSVFVSHQKLAVNGYQFPAYKNALQTFDFSNRTKGWIGFTAGVNIF